MRITWRAKPSRRVPAVCVKSAAVGRKSLQPTVRSTAPRWRESSLPTRKNASRSTASSTRGCGRWARAQETESPPGALVVHVIPLLFEGEWWRTFDATVVVIAPLEARIARVMERDGLDRAGVLERMRAQIDPEEARRRATYAIDNDGDVDALRERAGAVYDLLQTR